MQQEKIFFGPRDPHGEAPPTPSQRRAAVDYESASCPLYRFVGNDTVKKRLATIGFAALGKDNHCCRELALAFIGPTGSGKTTIARLYAEMVDLPFLEMSPKSLRSLDDLVDNISKTLGEEGLPLIEYNQSNYYLLPPMVIFIDEVHALSDHIVQGLLKATEYNDSILETESGKTVNCHNIMWMIATTDSGKLFDAFRTRFCLVELKYLSKSEISRVVKLNNPDWDVEVCDLVAHYNRRNARKALEFARFMRLAHEMNPSSWEQVAADVAADYGIDEFGMHENHLTVLKALERGPIARGRIGNVLNKKTEEMENYIMPWLLYGDADSRPMVKITGKGYAITEAGIAELDRRNVRLKVNTA